MRFLALATALTLSAMLPVSALAHSANPPATGAVAANLPVYDHIVIVVEENKDYDEIVGNGASSIAPFINGTLKQQGANLTRMYAEEHYSEGNYFWLFSGARPQHLNFNDGILKYPVNASNLASALLQAHYSFKGYSEDLPAIGSTIEKSGKYARKHVPWISFSNVPNGSTATDSCNLRFADFPTDYSLLPTVAFVIPNLDDDMHDGSPPKSITDGDTWLKNHLQGYYDWAKQHNSLLIVTFDENDHAALFGGGLTDPGSKDQNQRNRIPTILAGAHIKAGDYAEGNGITHVNLLRTLEAMYKLNKSGAQAKNAVKAGISDASILTDIFDTTR
jgi:phosphatidylinositol-3-phosphatase